MYFFFLNERNQLVLKLTIYLAWLKVGRQLYNKNIKQYNIYMCSWGRCLYSLASFSLSFKEIPSYSWNTGLVSSQTYSACSPHGNKPIFLRGRGTSSFPASLQLLTWIKKMSRAHVFFCGKTKRSEWRELRGGDKRGLAHDHCWKSLTAWSHRSQIFQSSSSGSGERKLRRQRGAFRCLCKSTS